MSFRLFRSVRSASSLLRAGSYAERAAFIATVGIALAGAFSCAQGVGGGTAANGPDSGATGDDDTTNNNGDDTNNVNPDSGAFGDDGDPGDPGDDTADGGGQMTADTGTMVGDDDDTTADTGTTMPPVDSGNPGNLCPTPLSSGALIITEIMISSASGSGDMGEWVEILNPSNTCAVKLSGITVASPRGSTGTDGVTITDGRIIQPGGTFVVADSSSASVNHNLPAPVYSWNNSDVLVNSGDTVTITAGGVALDTFTYPQTTYNIGKTFSFSTLCTLSQRMPLFSHWDSNPTHIYNGSFYGTPNAPNDDAACN